MKKSLLLPAIATAVFGFALQSQAQNITWGAAQNMVGDADVNVPANGILYDAVSFTSLYNTSGNGPAPTSLTVNGVTFNSFSSVTGTESGTLHDDGLIQITNGDGEGDYSSPNFSTRSPSSLNYSELVSSGAFGESSGTVTLEALTVGDTYQVESWSFYSGDSATATTTYSGATPVSLLNQTGQYAIGTFTATSPAETYTFSKSGGHNFMNAVDVFQTVPEPATFGMLAGGLGLLLTGQRIRRRRI
jgi:hypothetical protein